jgi:hypothetical protein
MRAVRGTALERQPSRTLRDELGGLRNRLESADLQDVLCEFAGQPNGLNTEAIDFKNATRVDALLSDLCLKYGICLALEDHDALVRDPPEDPDAFVDAILVAEGFDPILCDKQVKRWVTESVRDWIFDEGRGKGSASGLPLLPPA